MSVDILTRFFQIKVLDDAAQPDDHCEESSHCELMGELTFDRHTYFRIRLLEPNLIIVNKMLGRICAQNEDCLENQVFF
jgi:hypothetical protein